MSAVGLCCLVACMPVAAFGQMHAPLGPCLDEEWRASAPSAYLTSARVDPLCVRLGMDTFRLSLGVLDPQIVAVRMPVQGRFLHQNLPVATIELRDDGTNGDAMAGDGVYSLDQLSLAQTPGTIGVSLVRFVDLTFRYVDGHEETSQEDLGLTVHYVEQMVPVPDVSDLAPDMRVTPYVVNIVVPLEGEFPSHTVANETVAARYFGTFPDDRDFLLIAKPFNTTGFAASFRHVRNDIEGIGLDIFDDSPSYGSAGVLEGVVSLYFGNARPGTLNHELLHRWAAFLDPALNMTGSGGHWGAIAAGGSGFGGNAVYAGSFDFIEPVSGNLYRGWPGVSGYYNNLELYLMGLMGLEDVPNPIAALVNPVFQQYQGDNAIYQADNLRDVSTQEIVMVEGQRIPHHPDAQKSFRAALIVAHDRPLSDVELAYYHYAIQEYEKSSGSVLGLTFGQATGGRASISTRLPCMQGMESLGCVSIPAMGSTGVGVVAIGLLVAGTFVLKRRRRIGL